MNTVTVAALGAEMRPSYSNVERAVQKNAGGQRLNRTYSNLGIARIDSLESHECVATIVPAADNAK